MSNFRCLVGSRGEHLNADARETEAGVSSVQAGPCDVPELFKHWMFTLSPIFDEEEQLRKIAFSKCAATIAPMVLQPESC
jgi:hypothetical protein